MASIADVQTFSMHKIKGSPSLRGVTFSQCISHLPHVPFVILFTATDCCHTTSSLSQSVRFCFMSAAASRPMSASTQTMTQSDKTSGLNDQLRDDIYPTHNPEFQETPEHPSDTMKYELRHQKYINLRDLQRHLPDMEITSEKDIITIVGIPLDNDFDEISVLEVVQIYDESATIVSLQLA